MKLAARLLALISEGIAIIIWWYIVEDLSDMGTIALALSVGAFLLLWSSSQLEGRK